VLKTGSMRRAASVLGGVLLASLVSNSPVTAQELSEQAIRQIQAILADKATWTPTERKLATSLLMAHRQSRGRAMVQGLAPFPEVVAQAGVDGKGMVVIDIKAKVTDDLLRAIGDVGGELISSYPSYGAVRARLPIRRVDEIAALPEVRFVGPKEVFVLNTGSVTSQGDVAHAAAAARTSFGIDGTGVRVGVLSDGVGSLAARQTSGDLPVTCASPPAPGPCVAVATGLGGSGDEGTAMLEIVHDLAPGAQLFFATANGGSAAFASNIQTLRNTYGCDIIVDDITYLAEGPFQDGPIAQAVTAVKASGALYFSSAGNSGRLTAGTSGTWEGDFVNSGWNLEVPGITTASPMHSFNGLTGASAATSDPLTANSGPYIILGWSDPLGASVNDYDLFRVDSGFTTVLAYSVDSQTGTQDPIEGVSAGSTGQRIVITKYAGAGRALRLDTNRGRLSIATQGAVFGHNGGESTISVAATDGRTPGPGNPFTGGAANLAETYSSDGPRRIFYNPNGTAITTGNVLFSTSGGRLLRKPDITAADCVTTAFPTGGFNPFCGTSAAAPHAAAIAALLKSSPNNPSGGQALAAMFTTALDVNPGGLEPGWDRNSGVGIVMANNAANVLINIPNLSFFTVNPCRVFDTREVSGPTGGAPLTCGTDQSFTIVGGTCGVPASAKAVSLNVTATASTAQGNVRLFASGAPAPLVSSLNYLAGATRANNAVAPLSAGGQISVLCGPSGTTHVIVDINGYFQ
jgi:hypothetical protein